MTEPARLAGLRLEPGLVDLVLRDVAGEPGALPLLSHALRATWERRDGRTLTVEGYRRPAASARRSPGRPTTWSTRSPTTSAAGAQPVPAAHRARRGHRGHPAARGDRRARARGRLAGSGAGAARAARRRPPADPRRGHGRGRPRGAHPRVARACAAGSTRTARASACTAGSATPPGSGRPAAGRRPTSTGRPADRRARLGAGRRRRSSTPPSGRSWTRAARPASATPSASGGRTAACAPCWPGCRTARPSAMLAGVVAFVQRGQARDEALSRTPSVSGRSRWPRPHSTARSCSPLPGMQLDDRAETRGAARRAAAGDAGRIPDHSPLPGRPDGARGEPHGRLLASGDTEGAVRFHDIRTWKPAGPAAAARRRDRLGGDGLLAGRHRAGGGDGRRRDRSNLYLVDARRHAARRVASWRSPPRAPDHPGSPAWRSRPTEAARGGRGYGLAACLASPRRPAAAPARDARTGRVVWERRDPLRPGQQEVAVDVPPDGTLVTSAQQGQDAAVGAHGPVG